MALAYRDLFPGGQRVVLASGLPSGGDLSVSWQRHARDRQSWSRAPVSDT